MRLIISTRYVYSWVEIKNGIIVAAGGAWHNWPGRSLVALFTTFEDKKYPIRITAEKRTMVVQEFYQQFAEEFTMKEESNGSSQVA